MTNFEVMQCSIFYIFQEYFCTTLAEHIAVNRLYFLNCSLYLFFFNVELLLLEFPFQDIHRVTDLCNSGSVPQDVFSN